MDELNELLKPSWEVEKWILEGWAQLNLDEKKDIKERINNLFVDGLPFELKHDKLLYIYTFSLLVYLEVLAIQVPLTFSNKMPTPALNTHMHRQLSTEVFKGLVFTKIVYLLCAPYALPPAHHEHLELLCHFIRNEDCPKIGAMLLNLISEGWLDELFNSFKQQHIAPHVFAELLAKQPHHTSDIDLYRGLGMPDPAVVRQKFEYLEEQLLTNIFLEYKYAFSVSSLLGLQGMTSFMQAMHTKHKEQMDRFNLVPSEKWKFYTQLGFDLLPKMQQHAQAGYELEMSSIKKILINQWDNPADATMVGEFNLNVTCLDVLGKKYPPETLTTLMLQTVSQGMANHDLLRNFISYKKLYHAKEAYAAVVVKLPDCGDHTGTIVFENCHNMTVHALSERIKQIMQMMVYCYKKREHLEKLHPHLKGLIDNALYDFAYGLYPYPVPPNPVVTISNIGFGGYTQGKVPLRANEGLKFTLFEVERKQVWNKFTRSFEVQDILPVSISADHRIFDGTLPIPKIMINIFEERSAQMERYIDRPVFPQTQDTDIIKILEQLLSHNLEIGYKAFVALQTVWPEFISFENLNWVHHLKKVWQKRLLSRKTKRFVF